MHACIWYKDRATAPLINQLYITGSCQAQWEYIVHQSLVTGGQLSVITMQLL